MFFYVLIRSSKDCFGSFVFPMPQSTRYAVTVAEVWDLVVSSELEAITQIFILLYVYTILRCYSRYYSIILVGVHVNSRV